MGSRWWMISSKSGTNQLGPKKFTDSRGQSMLETKNPPSQRFALNLGSRLKVWLLPQSVARDRHVSPAAKGCFLLVRSYECLMVVVTGWCWLINNGSRCLFDWREAWNHQRRIVFNTNMNQQVCVLPKGELHEPTGALNNAQRGRYRTYTATYWLLPKKCAQQIRIQ